MNKLLLILSVLALPTFSTAGELVGVPGPGLNLDSNPTPRSFLASDIFISIAHTCQTSGQFCGPDNVVTSPFSAVVRFFVPVPQSYQFLFVLLDTEGAIQGVASVTFPIPTAPVTGSVFLGQTAFSVAGSSSVATRGLYKLIVLVLGADGRAAFSPYYGPVRVLP